MNKLYILSLSLIASLILSGCDGVANGNNDDNNGGSKCDGLEVAGQCLGGSGGGGMPIGGGMGGGGMPVGGMPVGGGGMPAADGSMASGGGMTDGMGADNSMASGGGMTDGMMGGMGNDAGPQINVGADGVNGGVATGVGGGDGGDALGSGLNGVAVLGPLVNAKVFVFDYIDYLKRKEPLYVTATIDSDNYDKAGSFDIPKDIIKDNKIYLIAIKGGMDKDSDDDGEFDKTFTQNKGVIHLLAYGKDLKDSFKVSILTEVVFEKFVKYAGTAKSYTILNDKFKDFRKEYIKKFTKYDINKDAQIDYGDILAWNPVSDKDLVEGGYNNYKKLIDKIHEGKLTVYDFNTIFKKIDNE